MKASDAVLFALENLSSRRMRTGLSTLGMMFGVAAVIAMLSIGAGAERRALAMIERLGVNNVLLRSKDVPASERAEARKKSMGLSPRDVAAIREAVPNVALVSPKARIDAYKVIADGYKAQAKIWGVSHRHPETARITLDEGRFFDQLDEQSHAQVCVIGAGVRRDLFVTGVAIGRFIKVNDVWLKVIGVLGPDSPLGDEAGAGASGASGAGPLGGSGGDSDIYLPLSTLLQKFERDPLEPPLAEIVVKLDTPATGSGVPAISPHESAAVIAGLLGQLHGGVDDFEVVVPEALLAQSRETQRIFSIVMGCIAGISLLVGGIGIMNIMLASVFEQTREIGVRRAVGALRRDIRFQFLVESFLVAGLGGACGVLLGLFIAHVVASYAGWPTVVTPLAIVLSTGVSGAVGLCSGLYPAIRASRLDPIEALAHQ
jgi:putative ABC transport system permease protein